jgi:hypothetical protein
VTRCDGSDAGTAAGLVDRLDRDGVEPQLLGGLAQIGAQRGLVEPVRSRDDQHHREAPAEDRHL